MREAARLQAFPDGFIFEGDKVSIAHQIGNAVPPLLGARVGAALRSALHSRELGIPRTSSPQLSLIGSAEGTHGADTAGMEDEP
jgi:DNA (cytosine-5)-methyltransferase 1